MRGYLLNEFETGLRNDTDPETFYLKYMDNNVVRVR